MTPKPERVLYCKMGQIALGNEIGRGGEGTIFAIHNQPNLLARIYHHSPPPAKVAKLQSMIAMAVKDLLECTAWPVDVLHTAGEVCGFVMHRAHGHREVHELYNPKSRRGHFPFADWRFLIRTAANIARAFSVVHKAGCVIGDVNHSSVLVSQHATVSLIDCDSYQIRFCHRTFPCEVGVVDFTPPELQGKSFRGLVRTVNHDNFGLAVLTFLLLFGGRHPFAGRYLGRDEMSLDLAIREYRYAFGRGLALTQMEAPPNTFRLEWLPREIRELFARAFSEEGANDLRPTASEWVYELLQREQKLCGCEVNWSHKYWMSLNRCPWCYLGARSGVELFATGFPQRTHVAERFDIEKAWRAIASVPPPAPPPDLPAPESLGPFMPTAEAVEAGQKWFPVGPMVQRRKTLNQVMHQARGDYETKRAAWERALADDPFAERRHELKNAYDEFASLRDQIQQEKAAMAEQLRRIALEAYLDRFPIASATIKMVGPKRKAELARHKITTARDATPANLAGVPGFGPGVAASLLDWRLTLESRFHFNSSRAVAPWDVTAIEMKYAEALRKLEQLLSSGASELERIKAAMESRRNQLRQELVEAMRCLEQARVNFEASRFRLL